MLAEIDTNPIKDNKLDWWQQMTSPIFVVHIDRDSDDISASAIWIASLIEPFTDAPELPLQLAFVAASGEDTGWVFNLRNESDLSELRSYKPLPKGFRLILTQN